MYLYDVHKVHDGMRKTRIKQVNNMLDRQSNMFNQRAISGFLDKYSNINQTHYSQRYYNNNNLPNGSLTNILGTTTHHIYIEISLPIKKKKK
jgi:hypothetical protein